MTKTVKLAHQPWCRQQRIELTAHEDVTVEHCIDCGAHWPPSPRVYGALAGQRPEADGGITMRPAQ
jgi:hypothetical protein